MTDYSSQGIISLRVLWCQLVFLIWGKHRYTLWNLEWRSMDSITGMNCKLHCHFITWFQRWEDWWCGGGHNKINMVVTSFSNKMAPRHIQPRTQWHTCSRRYLNSLNHKTGHQTAQIWTPWITASGKTYHTKFTTNRRSETWIIWKRLLWNNGGTSHSGR